MMLWRSTVWVDMVRGIVERCDRDVSGEECIWVGSGGEWGRDVNRSRAFCDATDVQRIVVRTAAIADQRV